MNKSIFTISVLVSIFSFVLFSCDDLEELADVTFDTTLSERIVVHVDQTAGTASDFNQTIVLNLDNADTNQYLDQINDLSVNSLSYKVIDFTGDPAGTIDAEFLVNDVSLLTNSFVVKTQADAGTTYEVDNVAQLNQIATALKNGLQVTAKYDGTALCDDDDMDFKVEVTIGISVTANPL